MTETTCSYCGQKCSAPPSRLAEFENHYCSRSCYVASITGEKVKVTCAYCGKLFIRRAIDLKTKEHYCSVECRILDHRKLETICANCGKQIIRIPSDIAAGKVYCSISCRAMAHRHRTKVACFTCGRIFERRASIALLHKKHFCSKECQTKNSDQEARNSTIYKKWRISVFNRDNYTCQDCNQHGIYLEAHHIKGWREFPELRFELTNGITLCIPCHNHRHNQKERMFP